MLRSYSRCWVVGLALSVALAIAGCSPTPPALTEVEGVVLLNDAPLPKAYVQFIPDLKHFGAEYNSTAITDEEGKFKLILHKTGEPGAAVAAHSVVITEAPLPRELRSQNAQGKAAEFRRSLANRPIPKKYGSVLETPLKTEVTADKKNYEIKLTR